jgi:hypothetical protein
MGMGSYAVSSFVIGYDDLKKIVPEEIKTIENEQFFEEIGWRTIGQSLAWDDMSMVEETIYFHCPDHDPQVVEDISEKYDAHVVSLQNAFHKKTGLTLYFDYYSKDDGDRYDEPNDKDGCIFCVDGMMQLTPAGEKYKNIVTDRKWTQFG